MLTLGTKAQHGVRRMIDTTKEHLITLSEAAARLPQHDGKKVHTSTLWRWARKGLRGVHLQYVRFGGRIYTSAEALNRFANVLAALDQAESVESTDGPLIPSSKQLPHETDAHLEAERRLKKAGL